MKKSLIWLLCVLALLLAIFGASLLYNKLSDKYSSGDKLVIDTPKDETITETDTDNTQEENNNNNNTEETTAEPQKSPAPDFTVTDIDGNEIKLSDMKGKPVVVNFWATWCYYCIEELPDFHSMYKEYGENVQFMMVNMTDGIQETVSGAHKYIESSGFTFPVYYDTAFEAGIAYNVTSLPRTYFIDANGNLVAHATGMINAETLKTGIEMIKE